MVAFFIIFTTIYTSINIYVFRRGLQSIEILSKSYKHIYRSIFIFWALAYIVSRILASLLNQQVNSYLLWIGAYWFLFLIYFLLFIIIAELVRLLNRFFYFLPEKHSLKYNKLKFYYFLLALVLNFLLVLYGSSNADNIIIKNITLTLSKKESTVDSLSVVFFSDSHLSTINDGNLKKKLVSKVNELKPDLILLGGDIVDDLSRNLRYQKIDVHLKKLSAKYGVYTCNGNHEWIVGVEDANEFLKSSNVIVLRDTIISIENILLLAAREDRSISRYTDLHRKPLKQILNYSKENLPIILLDHQPINLSEAAENKIDLQLSGHTHNGQFFPGNLITNLIYEISWGLKKKNDTQYYVSSGVGGWGPPVKILSDAEIINFKLIFK